MPHRKIENAGIELRMVYTVSPYEAMLVSHAMFAAAGDPYWSQVVSEWTDEHRTVVMDVARAWQPIDDYPIVFTNPYEHRFVKALTAHLKEVNDYRGAKPLPADPICVDPCCGHPEKRHAKLGRECDQPVETDRRTLANCPCRTYVAAP